MDAQCQESAVALKHFQNIADFDVVCTALGIDNIEVAFFRPEIVEEAQNHTNHTIALGIVTEHGDNDGEQHRSQNTKNRGANTACRGKLGALFVRICHGRQQRTHGNVQHGVEAFIQDLAHKQNRNHRHALKVGRQGP